jgi:hypothetical protein
MGNRSERSSGRLLVASAKESGAVKSGAVIVGTVVAGGGVPDASVGIAVAGGGVPDAVVAVVVAARRRLRAPKWLSVAIVETSKMRISK